MSFAFIEKKMQDLLTSFNEIKQINILNVFHLSFEKLVKQCFKSNQRKVALRDFRAVLRSTSREILVDPSGSTNVMSSYNYIRSFQSLCIANSFHSDTNHFFSFQFSLRT